MAGLKSLEIEVEGAKDLALVASDNSVWLVIPIRWWDLSTLIWWLFCPSDKKAKVKLRTTDEQKVSFWAARVATRHVRVTGRIQ
jgi:hypothetical protein